MSRIWPLWLCFCNKIHNIEYLQILKMKAMKKVMILSAAALMISLAMPQFTEATTVQNENTMIQVKEVQYQEITCLLYTSDAADEEDSVDLGGRRIIKKKKHKTNR